MKDKKKKAGDHALIASIAAGALGGTAGHTTFLVGRSHFGSPNCPWDTILENGALVQSGAVFPCIYIYAHEISMNLMKCVEKSRIRLCGLGVLQYKS